jgi:glutathione synthase/RimK-type ligase-like ATP-grasp enzyme
MTHTDIALLTDHRYTAQIAPDDDWYLGNILADDNLLQQALAKRGLTSLRVDWADPNVNWSRFRCAVFRTTWDYFDRFPEFTAWLDHLERQTLVCNPGSIIRWNWDKHYLADLAQRGVSIVPSYFLDRGTTRTLSDVLSETGWSEAVIKPCVSGAARHTYRVNRQTAEEIQPTLTKLLAEEAMMVQPFQTGITETGEDSLMVFGGKYSFAVRKVTKAGDFRVQDDHGGKVFPYEPTREQIDFAERAIATCSPMPMYGRVDMVRGNDGQLAIMELELIEPELWLRFYPPAAETFADAIVKFLENNS